MNSMAAKLVKFLRSSPATRPVMGVQGSSRLWYSTGTSLSDDDDEPASNNEATENVDDEFIPEKLNLQLQGVDPSKGWNFRGVHKAIICGKVGQSPVQKILRNGRTVTLFTVGTGGMFDQRIRQDRNLPIPGQWHRIAVHNDMLGKYSVQQLTKNSSVYIEGDIETRVYNDSLSGEVKSIPEICVRRDDSTRDRGRRRSYSRSRSRSRDRKDREDDRRKRHARSSASPARDEPKKKKEKKEKKEKKDDGTDHPDPEIAEANRLRASLGLKPLRP